MEEEIVKSDEEIYFELTNQKHELIEMLHLLREINNKTLRDDYISSLKEPVKTYIMDKVIEFYGSDEERKAWNKRIVVIPDITKLSESEIEMLPDDSMIRVCGDYTRSWQRQLYLKDSYLKIIKKFNLMLKDIKPAIKGNIKSEIVTFMMVYSRISKIEYDESTFSDYENNPELGVLSRNLEGGILYNKCVCEGYAEILRNALLLKGIKSKFIKGSQKQGSTHAWNQVRIGEKWFNVDLTWDREVYKTELDSNLQAILEVLKTDEEFKLHDKYELYRPEGEEKCETSILEVINKDEINFVR